MFKELAVIFACMALTCSEARPQASTAAATAKAAKESLQFVDTDAAADAEG